MEQAIALFLREDAEDEVDGEVATPALAAVVRVVTSPSSSFEALVSTLGPMLVDTQRLRERGRSVALLGEVLAEAGASLALPASAAESTAVFFVDRAVDDDSTGACLKGILAMLTHHDAKVSASTASKAVDLILTGGGGAFYVPSMAQAHRSRAIHILLRFLQVPRYFEAMRHRAPFFVSEFARAMDGEKDPRCLVTCLKVARAALRQFPDDALRGAAAGALFEVTSCYFPIMFTPPPNDPHRITRESLVALLRDVFTATYAMAPHLVPLLLEKAESTSEAVKVDALETLAACFVDARGGTVFRADALAPFLPAICDALFREVIEGTAKVCDAALNATRAIAARAVRSIVGTDASGALSGGGDGTVLLHGVHDALLQRCLQTLSAEASLSSLTSRAAAKVLHALVSVSPLTLARAVPRTWEIIEARYTGAAAAGRSTDATAAERLAVVEITTALLSALSTEVDFDRASHPIAPIAADVVRLLSASAGLSSAGAVPVPSTEEQVSAVRGLSCLLARPPSPLLAPAACAAVLEGLTALAVSSARLTVRGAALAAVVAAGARSAANAKVLSDVCWPVVSTALAASLAAAEAAATEGGDNMELDATASATAGGTVTLEPAAVLEAAIALSVPALPDVFRRALWTLLHTLVVVLPTTGGAQQQKRRELRFAHGGDRAHKLLAAMACIVEAGAGAEALIDECIVGWPAVDERAATDGAADGSLSISLVDALLGALMRDTETALPPSALGKCAALLGVLTRACSPPRQQELLSLTGTLLLAEPISLVRIPFVAAAVGVVGSVRFAWQMKRLDPLVARLQDLALASAAGAQMLAAVLNRLEATPQLDAMVERVSGVLLFAVAAEARRGSGGGGGALHATLWITKALLCRSHPTGRALASKLCALATGVNYTLAFDVAAGFGLVVRDAERVLTKRSGATVRRLYKQRFFAAVLPALRASLDTSTASLAALPGGSSESDEVATSLVRATRAPLLAIAAMANGVPIAVALGKIEELMLLLLRGLAYAAPRDASAADIRAARALRGSALAALHRLYSGIESLGAERAEGGVSGTHLLVRHSTTLTTLLLDASRAEGARGQPLAAARIMALTCLSWLAALPVADVKPLKRGVQRGLTAALDDGKRAVRRHAVRCRNDWALL